MDTLSARCSARGIIDSLLEHAAGDPRDWCLGRTPQTMVTLVTSSGARSGWVAGNDLELTLTPADGSADLTVLAGELIGWRPAVPNPVDD